MNCPNCNYIMKSRMHYETEFSTFCDDDEVLKYSVETYQCKRCKIKLVKKHDNFSNDQWMLPPELLPSEKQVKTILFINSVLHTNENPITKRQSWKFINKYLDKASKQKDSDFTGWCEDNQDWLPEYF